MGDHYINPPATRLERIGRLRVTLGFVVAGIAFWFATPSWASLGVGAVVAAFGETVRLWAAGHLRKGQEVTASGPYRFARHPLYLGSCVMGVGFAVASANAVVATVVTGYLVVMLGVAITLEEAMLRQKFGTAYERYTRGKLDPADRRFSLTLARHNGEYQTLLGFVVALGVLGLKVWFSGSDSGLTF